VRVEDYLTVLAAATGEAALVASGLLDIEHTELTPGSAVFGDAINAVLTGDALVLAAVPPLSVLGVFAGELVPSLVPANAVEPLARWYEHVAATVAGQAWGEVATTVGEEHRPTVLPLRAAFELRPAVDEAAARSDRPTSERHVPCVLALCLAFGQVQSAIDVRVATTLTLEVVFGMAKMVPMSRHALEDAGGDDPHREAGS
jgi:hypothetical protein